jgi:hypothetical protein
MDQNTLATKELRPCIHRRRTITELPAAPGCRPLARPGSPGPLARELRSEHRGSRCSPHENTPTTSSGQRLRSKNCQTAWRGAPVGIVQLRNTREQFLPTLVRPESAEPPLRETHDFGLRNRGSNHPHKYRRRSRGCQAARFRLTPPPQEPEPRHLGGARRAGPPRGGGISMRFGQPLRPIHLPGESGLVAFPVSCFPPCEPANAVVKPCCP